MKKHTLILFFRGRYQVCSTNDIHPFLKYKKKHESDLRVLMYIKGDYKRKIRHFGIHSFLMCRESYDRFETLMLQLEYDRIGV